MDIKEPISEISKISVTELRPNDIIIVKLRNCFSKDNKEDVFKVIKSVFPNNKLLFVDTTTEIEIIRKIE